MNSLQNFDRSLDKFLAWLSEAESTLENFESETEKLDGHRKRSSYHQQQLKVGHFIVKRSIKCT